MASVVQLVRTPVCGTGGRGFKSHHSPHLFPEPEINLIAEKQYRLIFLSGRNSPRSKMSPFGSRLYASNECCL